MKVYAAESELVQEIKNNTSFAYTHEISSLSINLAEKEKIRAGLSRWMDSIPNLVVNASKVDQDLYYTQSILVTSNWNKNDDVFTKEEVWVARHTPSHKPTNLEHDEHEIVGHITANWAINQDNKVLDDETSISDLPDVFHIVNGSVVYKAWQDEKLSSRAHKLIEEIETNKKFVSMECLFSGFDYAMITPEGEYKIIERNEDTAFLTKYLKAYCGTGIYNGSKLGRVLRNIIFSGKGFVDKPANPNSIIFNKENFFKFSEASVEKSFSEDKGVYYNSGSVSSNNLIDKEEIYMTDFLKDQNTELKVSVEDLSKKLAEATERLAKADVVQFEKKIEEVSSKLNAALEQVKDLENKNSEYVSKLEDTDKEIKEVKASRDEMQKDIEIAQAAELRSNRISTLVDGGIDKEIAEKKVDLYINLTDDQFSDLTGDLISVAKSQIQKTEDSQEDESQEETQADDSDVSEDEKDETIADESVLDETEQTEDLDLSVASDEPESSNIREKLRKAIAAMLGQDEKSDEEEK